MEPHSNYLPYIELSPGQYSGETGRVSKEVQKSRIGQKSLRRGNRCSNQKVERNNR